MNALSRSAPKPLVGSDGAIGGQRMIDTRLELRDTLRDRRPHDIRIDIEIAVDEVVPHADDESPRDFRVSLSELWDR